MATPKIVLVAADYDQGVVIQWELEGSVEPGVYNFTLQRSGTYDGDWEDLATNLLDTYIYTDTATSLSGLTRDIYYRVVAIAAISGNTSYSGPRNVQDLLPEGSAVGNHFLRAKKIRRDFRLTLEKFSGRQYYVLKQRHWGERCSECWDDLTRTVTDDDCATCYGIGFQGGYHTPYLIWGRIGTSSLSSPLQQEGKADQAMYEFSALQYPMLMPDDVIVSATTDRRYIVKNHNQTEMRRVTVRQIVSISELDRDDPAYKVAVP